MVGLVREQTGSFTASLFTLAASGLIAGCLALLLRNEMRSKAVESSLAGGLGAKQA